MAQVKVKIKIHRPSRPKEEPYDVEVRAYTTGVPGLVVHRERGFLMVHSWQITHRQSGRSVTRLKFGSRDYAIKACKLLADVLPQVDWTKTPKEILEAMQEAGIDRHHALAGAEGVIHY